MFRNQYDNDVTVWSPQGRIHQIEYAMEAVKQGSATVGLKSKTHAVLVALKRASSELSAHQKKIIPIDDHVGISIAGLTSDARLLSKFMRTECLNSHYAFDTSLPVSRLVAMVGNIFLVPWLVACIVACIVCFRYPQSESQINTQRYDRRPFGVGLLVAGHDEKGPHIYQTCPSANYYECRCMAIGARSQSARTYLEKHMDEFLDCTQEELVKHGLRALQDTLPNETELSTKNCSVAIVGKSQRFTIYENDDVAAYLSGIEASARAKRAAAAAADKPAAEASADSPMATGEEEPAAADEPAAAAGDDAAQPMEQ